MLIIEVYSFIHNYKCVEVNMEKFNQFMCCRSEVFFSTSCKLCKYSSKYIRQVENWGCQSQFGHKHPEISSTVSSSNVLPKTVKFIINHPSEYHHDQLCHHQSQYFKQSNTFEDRIPFIMTNV